MRESERVCVCVCVCDCLAPYGVGLAPPHVARTEEANGAKDGVFSSIKGVGKVVRGSGRW